MSQRKYEDSMTYIKLSSMPYDDWIITLMTVFMLLNSER